MDHQNDQKSTIPYPQVSLQDALKAGLSVYAGHPGPSPMSEHLFRQLLGLETTSGSLLRLTSALKMYGLIARSGRLTALTSLALELYSTDDRAEFGSLLQAAARRPQIVRDLGGDYAAGLRPDEIQAKLSDLGLNLRDRKAVLGLLLDNERDRKAEERSGDLFALVQYTREHRPAATAPVGLSGARHWLNTLPGRTANLTLVAVLFVGSLMYFAFSPSPSTQPTSAQMARSVPAPTPQVSVPASSASGKAVPGTAVVTVPTEPRALASNQAQRAAPAANSAGPPQTNATGPATLERSVPASEETARAAPARTAQAATPGTPGGTSSPSPRTVQTPTATASVPALSASTPQVLAGTLPPAQTSPAASSASPAASVQANPALPPLEHGRELTQLFYSQRLVGIWRAFSPAVRREWGAFPSFVDYRQGGLETFGAETAVLSEEVRSSGRVRYYTRTVTFERGPQKPWTVIFGFDQSGTVVAFNIVAAEVLPSVLAVARP